MENLTFQKLNHGNIFMSDLESFKLMSDSETETINIGYYIGKNASISDVILIYGEMGAGKTRLTSGISKGIGNKVSVRSPTFVIVNEYPGEKILYHCDFYRINNVYEAYDLDLESKSDLGIIVVEWPDNFEEIFSQNILKVRIEISENFDNRVISFQSTDNRSKELMKSIKKSYKKKNEYISN